MGTAVGTKVFIEHGWRAAAVLSMAWYGLQIAILLIRGPHVERYTWFGYEGGLEARKNVIVARNGTQGNSDEEAAVIGETIATKTSVPASVVVEPEKNGERRMENR